MIHYDGASPAHFSSRESSELVNGGIEVGADYNRNVIRFNAELLCNPRQDVYGDDGYLWQCCAGSNAVE